MYVHSDTDVNVTAERESTFCSRTKGNTTKTQTFSLSLSLHTHWVMRRMPNYSTCAGDAWLISPLESGPDVRCRSIIMGGPRMTSLLISVLCAIPTLCKDGNNLHFNGRGLPSKRAISTAFRYTFISFIRKNNKMWYFRSMNSLQI